MAVLGVGVYIKGKYRSSINNMSTKEYMLWVSMLTRVYSEAYLAKSPTYRGCSVSENFKDFQYFAEWCQLQVGFGNDDWHLDKDILSKGNKVYSEDTCVFVPREINYLLNANRKKRGEFPIGVCYDKPLGKFKGALKKEGRKIHLGYFTDSEDAHTAYLLAKEAYVKDVAELWKGKMDIRAYHALLNWKCT